MQIKGSPDKRSFSAGSVWGRGSGPARSGGGSYITQRVTLGPMIFSTSFLVGITASAADHYSRRRRLAVKGQRPPLPPRPPNRPQVHVIISRRNFSLIHNVATPYDTITGICA